MLWDALGCSEMLWIAPSVDAGCGSAIYRRPHQILRQRFLGDSLEMLWDAVGCCGIGRALNGDAGMDVSC